MRQSEDRQKPDKIEDAVVNIFIIVGLLIITLAAWGFVCLCEFGVNKLNLEQKGTVYGQEARKIQE